MINNALYPEIELASGWNYYFVAADKKAQACIDALTQIMHLEKGPGRGRKVFVYCSEQEDIYSRIYVPPAFDQPVLCRIDPFKNRDEFYLMAERIAQSIAVAVTNHGGALVHGGLCTLYGQGAIMAGSGGVGKSTASSRLPYPWISHCDDSTLVVPGSNGTYFAHPWPTWSRFFSGGSGGSWDVELYYPLTALFFLSQSEEDQLEVLNNSQAVPMLIDTIEHVTRTNRKKGLDRRNFLLKCIRNAEIITGSVPAYRLRVSLGGHFWVKMEKVLLEKTVKTCLNDKSPNGENPAHQPMPELLDPETPKEIPRAVHYIYRGTSMNPTFYEPELLTVYPYKNIEKPLKGDVICYHTEGKAEHVVHRVIAVKDDEIRTRGDNSRNPDQYTLTAADITGRVVSSSRNGKKRLIYGGTAGIINMQINRISRDVNRLMTRLLRKIYHGLADTGLLRRIKPAGLCFKVVVFSRFSLRYPKLIMNGRTVGNFDFRKGCWTIKRPYRLFVDAKSLPYFERTFIPIVNKENINQDC